MKDPKKIAAKRLKRKRKVAAKKKVEREGIAAGRIIVFGGRKFAVSKGKKSPPKVQPKGEKPMPAYRAVKLTAQLDTLTAKIREADPKDPKLQSLKKRRDIIKKKLNQK